MFYLKQHRLIYQKLIKDLKETEKELERLIKFSKKPLLFSGKISKKQKL